MRLGVVILPEDRWADGGASRWTRAEALGFDHAWTYDHLAWRMLRDGPWFGAVPVLAAASAVTSRIRLGMLVASPNFRHPVTFARELLALDDVSEGRFTLGIGSGGTGWDATILGQEPWPLAERMDRFAEFVDLLDRVLTDREVDFDGRFWSADGARSHPGCVQQPRIPFAVAATGPRSMRVAARHGSTWVTNGSREHEGPPLPAEEGAALVARQRRRLDEVCEAEGRDPGTLDTLVLTGARLDGGLRSGQAFAEVRDAYRSVGAADLAVHWPRPEPPYAGDESILADIAGSARDGHGGDTTPHPAIQQAFELAGDPDRITEYYDGWAETYDHDVGEERYAGPATCVEVLRACAGLVDSVDVLDPDLTIVDGGCGTGLVGVELARAGYTTVDGVDLSPAMVDAARARGVYRELEAGVDLTQPPEERWARSADVMVLAGVFTLGHLPGRTLETLAGWVRPGGLIVVSTRRQYYETSDFAAVAEELVAAGVLTEIARRMNAPGTEDSPAHYFSFRVT